jgi:adenylate cyclase
MEFLLAGVFVSLGSTGYKYVLEEKGKRLLRSALSQYLAEDLVSSVLDNYDEVKLGGDRRDVTLFFSDIAGFTTLSEKMEPEELVRFLSVYLKEASDIIMKEKGFINKYEGDAVMAIWGAFREQPDQAKLACAAALEQQEKIAELNARFRLEFGFEIGVRMGINEGPAVVGNIGSAGKKIEFTALGDTVNTASRFEGINKLYGTLICVGESVKEAAKDAFVFRRLDSIMVKGKDKPTAIYELVGRAGEVPDSRREMIAEFERALALYVEGKVSEARGIFERLWKDYRDPPSEVFFERCGKLVEEGVPAGWTGVYRATEK